MNIRDPNLLEIIAKYIDSKQTFNNFAKSSRVTSNIARKLTSIKKFQFKYIEFDKVYPNSCIWNGCYTKGIVSLKNTRVWFYPSGLEVIYDSEINIKDYNGNFKIHDFHIENDYILGDFCQLREPHINVIVDGLKNKTLTLCVFTSNFKEDFQTFTHQMDNETIDFLKNKNLMIYHDCGYILNIWIVRDLEAAIEELEKVREFCHNNKILIASNKDMPS
jgi:hypothetical protein